MKTLIFTSILTIIGAQVWSQDIKGKVVDKDNEAEIGAEVSLLNYADSAVIKYSLLESDGSYLFTQIPTGKYLIKLQEGSNKVYSSLVDHNEQTVSEVPLLKFAAATTELQGVDIVYQRPLIEMKPDRLVFNVDSTINAVGQNGLELMRKSPGVVVDKDENLTMNGKNGIRVYIDGKLSPLTGTELSEFLKTIQSSSIDAIEIISNPSAKYDAAGNAGIINIKLKKNKLVGTNGSVNAGYAIQKYSKYNGGFTLNHRNEKVNLYGSYNINTGKHWNNANFERIALDTFFQQKSNMERKGTGHNYKAGVDYFLNDQETIGIMVNGNMRDNSMINDNNTDFYYNPTGDLTNTLQSNNRDESSRTNNNINLNYQFNNKNKNKSLTLDADYGNFSIKSDQYQPNLYYSKNGTLTNSNIYNLLTGTDINIYSLKGDYEQPFAKGKLGIGAKVTLTQTENEFTYNREVNNEWTNDKERSNDFAYNENIQAIYGLYQRQLKGVAVQVGVRAENTITTGTSVGERWNGNQYVAYETENPRNYFNIFPNLGVTLNKNPMNMWNFIYNKRIDRPNYQDLNPFEYKMTDYSYRKGNILLRPQITNAFSVTHTYKFKLNTRLEYAHTTDVFAELVDTINGGKLFQTKENLATQDIISLNISYPFAYKNFSSFFNVNTYYSMFKADYGNGRKIDLDVFAANFYGQIGYKINEWLSAEVSGWYTTPSIWQGTFKSIAMGGIDAGIQARVLKGKGNIKASMGDILNTMKWGGSSNFAGQYVNAYGRWESQQFRINFTYNFGNNKIKSTQRKSGTEDETKRAGESQGIQQSR